MIGVHIWNDEFTLHQSCYMQITLISLTAVAEAQPLWIVGDEEVIERGKSKYCS